MKDTKNEPVIEFAKNFIDDCNNFEIKNLDSAKSGQNNSPDISLFSDFIKEYLNPIEEEQNQNLIKTGNKDLDELCIFEKGMFKLFCTDEFNVPLARMVNSFVIEAVAGGKRVLIISPYPNIIVRNFLKAIVRKDHQNNLSWFDDKKLYFYECMPDDNIVDLAENLRARIIDLNIDVLYIPYLEDLLQNYFADLQISTLEHLYNFAFDTNICIVSTLASFDYHGWKNEPPLFYPQHKLDIEVLKKSLPAEAMYITSFANNMASFDDWSVWDSINDTPSKVSVQSFDDFYTFDSISIKPRLV
ncbi:hypothetical protein [uncultured Eubacterium sp.]|uniref:hypothetical protein n=1 Tax=uncultured Eubacterium sp. TaxID=165185 RepID=UPI0025E63658|nr:hypothetical protein [uncultured Eubacterium sp.]